MATCNNFNTDQDPSIEVITIKVEDSDNYEERWNDIRTSHINEDPQRRILEANADNLLNNVLNSMLNNMLDIAESTGANDIEGDGACFFHSSALLKACNDPNSESKKRSDEEENYIHQDQEQAILNACNVPSSKNKRKKRAAEKSFFGEMLYFANDVYTEAKYHHQDPGQAILNAFNVPNTKSKKRSDVQKLLQERTLSEASKGKNRSILKDHADIFIKELKSKR